MHCLIFSFKKHTNWPQLCISSSYSCIHGLHCHRGVSGPSSPLSPERGSPGLAEAGGGAWQPRLRGLPVDEGSRARSGRFQVTRPRQLASPGLPPTSCAHPMLPPQGLWPLCAPPQGRGRRAWTSLSGSSQRDPAVLTLSHYSVLRLRRSHLPETCSPSQHVRVDERLPEFGFQSVLSP